MEHVSNLPSHQLKYNNLVIYRSNQLTLLKVKKNYQYIINYMNQESGLHKRNVINLAETIKLWGGVNKLLLKRAKYNNNGMYNSYK